jgi:hypothetical protein
MWITEFSMECKVSEARIWQVLTDVENWKDWIGGIKTSTIHGNFEDGTLITIKNINMPNMTNRLKDVVVNKSFILQSKMLFCTFDGIHEIVKENDVLKIRLGIKISGALTFIFKGIVGKSAAKSIPIATKKLVELAEK